jgi:thiol-disulfide isomerase/thioredoxin
MVRWSIVFYILVLPGLLIKGQESGSNHVRTMNFSQLEPLMHYSNDTVYLINFWATWCAPCREELSAIEQVREKYKNYKLRVILVSLDFPKQLNSQLIPFINKHHIKSEVILLDDPNQNSWINKVDMNWSGEIPFTVLYSSTFREFYPQSFNFQNLESLIKLKFKIP